ncbi:MAG: ATP-binding cassette domain-containing protein, partial [Bacteroidales bacterium]
SYIMDNGSVIRNDKIIPLYYSDVAGKFYQASAKTELVFVADNIEYKFRNSENGIQPLHFSARAGQLVGIMGGSGTGKSTLLNLLNGNYKPGSGRVLINDVDLNREQELLEGIIGYVPQDDLLIEELTVFQNLFFNARLCFSDYSERQILQVVARVLQDLDLTEIKHLKVGDPLNKTISGGQRKRLNIGLELMREPSILFVDEPTSGLSSMDSEMVMLLLKEQTLKGKLVIVNIHQPSSFIFKLFDKLLILDKGGYPIYQGNPLDAVTYFKRMSSYVNADERQCVTCGNVNPEQVLQIVETKFVNQYGKYTGNRRVSPKEWYQLYKENIENKKKVSQKDIPLPESRFKIPGRMKQFIIFCQRNILSKISNTQYLLVNFLETPLLAVIIGYFTKYISGIPEDPHAYVFFENDNLPAYLFMSVVVALFVGMTVSAEEIIRDARLLKRESFLHLSRFSYLNSKVVVLFIISAIQTLSFVLIGNAVLEIKGMSISFWIVLFTAASMANLIGLNISSAFNSVVTIYILVPLILVPQLLFSGAIVPFDKLHKRITTSVYVPIIGELMTSRWAYEALTVRQFGSNAFQKEFFSMDQEMSNASYYSTFLIPRLLSISDNIRTQQTRQNNKKKLERDIALLKNELDRLGKTPEMTLIFPLDKIGTDSLSLEAHNMIDRYLENARMVFNAKHQEASYEKDLKYNRLVGKLGSGEAVLELRNDNHNRALADILLNRNLVNKIHETRTRLVRKKDP